MQHLTGQYNCFLQCFSRVISHLVSVLTMYWGTECHFPCSGNLAIALFKVDMWLVEKKGQDAGVQSVCDEDFSHTHQSNGASKVLHVVKMFVQFTLHFVLEVRSNRTLNTGIKKLFPIPPINKFKTEMWCKWVVFTFSLSWRVQTSVSSKGPIMNAISGTNLWVQDTETLNSLNTK